MMKIKYTSTSLILIVLLIAGCSHRYHLGMDIGSGEAVEDGGVFGEFTRLVDDTDRPGANKAIKEFLDKHSDAITTTYDGKFDYTFLHRAAEEGILWLVKDLIEERGVPVDIKTEKSGTTPLQCAAVKGRMSVVKFLLEKGANVYEEDKNEAIALQYAVIGGQLEVFMYLHDAMTQHNKYKPKKDHNGLNLLHLVALSVNAEQGEDALRRSRALAEFLIQQYGNDMISEPDSKGFPPFHFAATNGNRPLLELMIEHGANEKITRDKRTLTARVANRRGYPEIADLIVGR